ncbi:VWA domain-containing protein, partial [Streptomyces fuscigenes]|uniref:VWA domain-containing protein n=1 Tax=Streptomyces fuscigenes TaxID=1528880 RepID=UPI001F205CB5
LVLDASASMSVHYASGAVADVVERAAAAALALGSGRMPAWTFATHPARLPDCAVDGALPEWLRLHVRAGQLALLGRPRRRARGLHPDQVDMRCVGVRNEEQRAIAQVRAYVREQPAPGPTFVVFLTGGGVRRGAEIGRQLAEGAGEPVFWQFVGLGHEAAGGVLPHLGTQESGRVANTGFLVLEDVARTSDAELYDRLLSMFPAWLDSARRAGVVD